MTRRIYPDPSTLNDLISYNSTLMHHMDTKQNNVNCFVLRGGLGNQLFILSAAIVSSIQNQFPIQIKLLVENRLPFNTERKLEILPLIRAMEIELCEYNKLTALKELASWRLNDHPESYFEDAISNQGGIQKGYFQDTRIVQLAWKELQERFLKAEDFSSLLSLITFDRIAIHFRSGDIRSSIRSRFHHGSTNLKYYLDAAKLMQNEYDVKKVLLISEAFTPEIDQLNLLLVSKGFEVDLSVAQDSFTDLRLLAQSKYVVCSNSSYSWWGAWLSKCNGGIRSVMPIPWLAGYSAYDSNLVLDTSTHIER